jgi:catechol 2,3-dioxygenase-like lactoylglutathione lyase family enzyme
VTKSILVLALLTLYPARAAWAQIAPANAQGVAMGHLHFFVKDVDAYQKMFVAMGGVAITHNSGVKFPGAIMYLRQGNPTSPMVGSVVGHVGFIVPHTMAALAKWKAAGLKTEVGTLPAQGYVYTPDDFLKIEILQDTTLTVPIAFHHIHFFVPDPAQGGGSGVKDIQAWYAKVFGAIPGMRGKFDAAALPGVSLTFSKSDTPTVPTEGHSLDHIGFEVNGLQAFCEKQTALGVKFDSPCTKPADSKSLHVFLTDPWGTKIELTSDMREY